MPDIHPQLLQDCLYVGRFKLCHLLLMNDAHFPWLILVPDREGISEIYELDINDQQQLIAESSLVSRILHTAFDADKINIGALGNIVPQLHIHHIARYKDDAAWPGPIWGAVKAIAYTKTERTRVIDKLKQHLIKDFTFAV